MDVYQGLGVATFVASLLTIIGNSLVVVAFQMLKSHSSKPSNLLILALAYADLVYGTYMFVYYGVPLAFGLGHPYGELGCKLTILVDYSYNFGNLLLIAISIDRVLLVSVKYPRYTKLQSAFRVKITIAICFCISLSGSLIEFSLWNYARRNYETASNIDYDQYCLYPTRRMKWFGLYISFGSFCTPSFIICILSGVFFVKLYGRIRKSRKIGSDGASVTTYSERSAEPTQTSNNTQQDEGGRKRYVKPAVTLAGLVAAMCISNLPYCIFLIVEIWYPPSSMVNYILWLNLQLNPLLDLIAYAATQKHVRKFYKKKITNIACGWFATTVN